MLEARSDLRFVKDVPNKIYFVHVCIVYVGLAQARPNYGT